MTKRLTAIFLAVLAVLTLAACGQGETAPGTMGTMLAQVFEERGKADPNLDLTDLGNTLMNDSGLPIDGEVTPVEPGLLMGFGNDEITGFAEGHVRPRHRHHPLCGLSFPLGCGDRRRRLCPDIEGPGQPPLEHLHRGRRDRGAPGGGCGLLRHVPRMSMDEDGGDGVSDLS
ncbi:MAG: hypothetical protein ACLUNZ_05825 [Evtepia sp.]